MRTKTRWAAAAAALGIAAGGGALAGCSSGGGDSGGDAKSITVWSLENQTDRVRATQKIADRFTSKTGIKVKIVGTDENQFSQLITSAGAAGKLPDVVGALPLAAVRQMASNELLDTRTAKQVVADLGAGTFARRSLELTRDKSTQLAVPSDGWAQLLVYRKDLFDAAGLPAPDTFQKITAAAQALNKGGMAGITMATVPDDAFTEQTFENFALANGCQLVDSHGKVTLDSKACVDTFSFYGDLVRKYGPAGAQDVDSTRATYFAGKAAMVVWSSFLLDEMAGLRKDALPSCPECRADTAYLAKNSGIVTAVKGPDGRSPAQFGELTSWVASKDGHASAAKKFIEYMMSDGYADWLGIAPEGKFPARQGTKDDGKAYVNAWNTLPAGVDVKKPLGQIYPAAVLDDLRTSPDTFQRWGITQGQGALVGATLGELPVPKAVNALANGETDAAGAARRATADVKSIQSSLK
ncbi:MAG: extracellular solute-binding protein [Mycobacteriales bacterium]